MVMGERRRRKPGKRPDNLWMLLPMSIRCNSCDKCMYKGTLFRSRKEEAEICSLSGIQRFRFYLNCTGCSAELAIKTYPHYPHFTVETGDTHCLHVDETRRVPTDDDDEEDEPGIPNLIRLDPIRSDPQ